jgi:mannose-6-phosphate isomerase-like protein (cupin superfamily)
MNTQGKVWGQTISIFNKNNVEIHKITVKKGGYCSRHKHQHKHNMFFVESGEIQIHIWKNDYDLVDITTLKENQITTVKPNEYHKFIAKQDTVAYEIYWTEICPNDIVRTDVGGLPI